MLTKDDINEIAEALNLKCIVVDYELKNASEKMIGYLGEHLKLELKTKDGSCLKCFVKCVPRHDPVKATYINKCTFFKKEHAMLNALFRNYSDSGEEGPFKWRPKVLLLKEYVFVFEDMPSLGYILPDQENCLTMDEIKCIVKTISHFHASSYIYEEEVSNREGKTYRIYEEFKEFLQEPSGGKLWRDTGMKAIIDMLSIFSKHKEKDNFREIMLKRIPKIFANVTGLMKPSRKYRNVVVHRDLWTNNIFLKYDKGRPVHAVIVDFQTVLYASPFIDLSSFLCMNTDSEFRKEHTAALLDLYYSNLEERLKTNGIDVTHIMTKDALMEAYEESIMFGLTQASLIVPMVAMDSHWINKHFNDPAKYNKINEVCRSEEYVEIATHDDAYRNRVMDLFEELVERYALHD